MARMQVLCPELIQDFKVVDRNQSPTEVWNFRLAVALKLTELEM